MQRDEIVRRANTMIAREFELDPAKLTAEATLYEDLALDSLDSVDLIAALEREFGVKIDRRRDEAELRAMRRLEDVYAFIAARLAP